MAVGAHKPERGLLVRDDQGNEQAVQDIARIIVPCGKQRFPDQFQQPGAGERNQPFAIDHRQGRVLGTGQADDLELALARLNRCPIVIPRRQLDLAGFQLFDDLIQLARREGHAARLQHRGLIESAHADFQVRRDNLNAVLFGFQQNVGENRHGVPFLHHALHTLETRQQFIAPDAYLHSVFSLNRTTSTP